VKNLLLRAFCFALVGFVCLTTGLHAAPNVIVIYTDDQGTLDLNSYGSKDLVTPHMDALVASGIRFTQFYAAPVCTPSRVSLLTGMSPQRAGVEGNISAVSGQTAGLSTELFTMVDLFKNAGYRAGHIGKWHLGFAEDKQPLAHGFDYSFGHLVGCIDNYSHFYYWRGPNRHDLQRNGEEVFHDGEFFPELMLTEAKAFIDESAESPFFLFFALNTPHYPYQGYPRWLEYYNEKGVPYPRNLYAAFLSTQDEIIGRLIQHLDTNKLREDTIIIFQSDNGHSTEERAHFGGGNTGVYRGAKAGLFEGGIRVPAAISWPAVLPAGETRDQLSVNTDWLPTLAELCELEMPTAEIEGKSLVPVIADGAAADVHDGVYHWEFRDQWAVREGDWKLLFNPVDKSEKAPLGESDMFFLVDLANDPGELTNLAVRYPEKVAQLRDSYRLWKAGL
jgi:arylsulfatase A